MSAITKNIHKKPVGIRSNNLAWCKRLVKLYIGDYGSVKVSDVLHDKDGFTCYSMYDPRSDVIWVRSDVLDSKRETFKALVHETVHRLTGASDGSTEFILGFENACWGILMKGKI